MKALLLVTFLVGAVVSSPLSSYKRQTNTSAATYNETTELLEALGQANLTSLSSLFTSYPSIIEQVSNTSGFKTILAPTNEAIEAIPGFCSSNSTCLQNTMLMHILNGIFDVHEFQVDPTHTVGHSFLTDAYYANLPGGNGQAVALSLANYSSIEDEAANADNATAIMSLEAATAKIQEGLNVSQFKTAQAIQTGNYIIYPVLQTMTIPGGPLDTLRVLGRFARFIHRIEAQGDDFVASINGMRGVTIFAPTNQAWRDYEDDEGEATGTALAALILNHFVADRAVYSPLLEDQGSMVTMAGQDIAFSSGNNSVIIGNCSANITQFDIMHRGGVIHTIDAVLTDTADDSSRATQAADSALNSTTSNIAGPVSYQNAASSQGTSVPASVTATDGQVNANSTVTVS
jgi:uncharacterized surface protein with fasciclin (FAS1) repeats